jgi:hypothetical protein
MTVAKLLLILSISVVVSGCIHYDADTDKIRESVMTKGMIICADFDEKVCVMAENSLVRRIMWDGIERSVTLIPRKERWYGKLGLYFPGSGNHWEYHKGITRGIVQEAQLHFDNEKDLALFLDKYADDKYDLYRDDGLMISWRKVVRPDMGSGGYIDLFILQLLVNGKKPERLNGSQNDKISVTLSVH